MKKIVYLAAITLFTSNVALAQTKTKFGLKAGYNWSYLTGNKEGFKPDTKTGFMASAFLSPTPKSGLGYRTELVFSRQGYSFNEGGKNTDVLNDYIYLPQLTTFTIGNVVQLQAGAQIGYLLKSREKTEAKDSTITGLMKRFDYGFVGGIEVYPFKGIIMGGRYNLGLGKLHKQIEANAANPYPLPFNPETTDYKNSLFQFFIGYRF